MDAQSQNTNRTIVVKYTVSIYARLIFVAIFCIWAIVLAMGKLNLGIPIGILWLVWIMAVMNYILYMNDFGFSDEGILLEKFGRQIVISWDEVMHVTRGAINTQIHVSGKTLTRFERFLTTYTISLTPLFGLNYEEVDQFIREKVGTKYYKSL